MSVLASGIKQIKLLGVPSIRTKVIGKYDKTAANDIRKEIIYTLKCTHKVFGMVFDTTNCNTGAIVVLVFFYRKFKVEHLYGFLVVTTYVR